MLSGQDLKDYRLLKGLSLRDVARYCNITAQMIGQAENGVWGLTESTYREIVKGINGASQAIARGTFEIEKAKEREEQREKDGEKQKTVEKKVAATKKSNKPTTKKTITK